MNEMKRVLIDRNAIWYKSNYIYLVEHIEDSEKFLSRIEDFLVTANIS